jgi:hypothetical protein
MAENETLDLGGTRYRRSRDCLGDLQSPTTAIADQFTNDLLHSVRVDLSKAFKGGQTLLTVLRAAESEPAALRAVVANFSVQGLARLTREAIKEAKSADPALIANFAATRLIDACFDKAVALSSRYERFQDAVEKEHLRASLHERFRGCRTELVAVLESSLRGNHVPRKPRANSERLQKPITAQMLASRPLATRNSGAGHAARLQ